MYEAILDRPVIRPTYPGAKKTILVVIIVVLSVLGFLVMANAAELPKPPQGLVPAIESPVAHCGANYGVYQRGYDTDPTNAHAAMFAYGVFESRDSGPEFNDPVLVQVVDSKGDSRFYLKQLDGTVREMTRDQVRAEFPDPCSLPGVTPPPGIRTQRSGRDAA